MGLDLIMPIDVLHVSALETSAPDVERRRASRLATIFIFLFVAWIGLQAPFGIMSGTDELLTAERTREMLLTERWEVHYNFQPSFEKPPLQYWLTSLTLPRFQSRAGGARLAIALQRVDFDRGRVAGPFGQTRRTVAGSVDSRDPDFGAALFE